MLPRRVSALLVLPSCSRGSKYPASCPRVGVRTTRASTRRCQDYLCFHPAAVARRAIMAHHEITAVLAGARRGPLANIRHSTRAPSWAHRSGTRGCTTTVCRAICGGRRLPPRGVWGKTTASTRFTELSCLLLPSLTTHLIQMEIACCSHARRHVAYSLVVVLTSNGGALTHWVHTRD